MKVRVYTDYDPIRILRGVSGKEFMEPTDELALKSGLEGAYSLVEDVDVLSDRSDRDCWAVEEGQVKVNAQKKAAKDAAKAEKKLKKETVIGKLKITAEELKELLA